MEAAGVTRKVDRAVEVGGRVGDVADVAGVRGLRGRGRVGLERADVASAVAIDVALIGGQAVRRIAVADRLAVREQRLRARRAAVVGDRRQLRSASAMSSLPSKPQCPS
jgi:hypothetical protein